jgi:hypothetical protein
MKKQIAKHALPLISFIMLCAIFTSCKKNDIENQPATVNENADPTIRSVNGRLVFENTAAFYKVMEQLDKSSTEEITRFEQTYHHASFRTMVNAVAEDYTFTEAESDLRKLPQGLQTMLNKAGEVQIGDSIVWYNKNVKHYVVAADEAALQSVKQHPTDATVRGGYGLKFDVPVNQNIGGGKGNDPVPSWIVIMNGADARHQKQFWQNSPAAGWRKFVHEVGLFTDYYSQGSNTCGQATYFYYTACYLYIKMEWKGCCNWKPAGENREISYNLTCTGNSTVARGCGIVDYPGFYATPSGSTVRNSELNLTLGTSGGYTVSNPSYYPIYWSLNVEGNIYQHVVGDSQYNEWNNTGYPLW